MLNAVNAEVNVLSPSRCHEGFGLTEEQVVFFNQQGFLHIERMTTDDDVAMLREIYDDLFERQAGRDEGNQFDLGGADEEGQQASLPQILNPAKYAPELNDSLLLKNVQAVAMRLLGPEAKTSFAHAIFKPPHHGAETLWHQDAAYWNPDMIHRGLSVWVPLQPATLENGCMHFIPGSDQFDVVEHQSINNDPRIHGLEIHPALRDRYIKPIQACPLDAGGCTIHNGYTFHYAPANRSDIPRRALILMASIPGTKRIKPRRFPWMEEKQTAREQRAKQAHEKSDS